MGVLEHQAMMNSNSRKVMLHSLAVSMALLCLVNPASASYGGGYGSRNRSYDIDTGVRYGYEQIGPGQRLTRTQWALRAIEGEIPTPPLVLDSDSKGRKTGDKKGPANTSASGPAAAGGASCRRLRRRLMDSRRTAAGRRFRRRLIERRRRRLIDRRRTLMDRLHISERRGHAC